MHVGRYLRGASAAELTVVRLLHAFADGPAEQQSHASGVAAREFTPVEYRVTVDRRAASRKRREGQLVGAVHQSSACWSRLSQSLQRD